jgi:hypothetical protein
VRAYELARQHKPVPLAPVEVEIYALELLGIEVNQVRFAVECSGGTYVRSLVHDLGQRVGCGAYLEGLRRTAVAEFPEGRAISLDRLQEVVREGKLDTCLAPLEALLPDCPELVVRGREEATVRHGHKFELAQALRPGRGGASSRSPAATLLKILNPERRLIAVARHVSGSIYHPNLVLVWFPDVHNLGMASAVRWAASGHAMALARSRICLESSGWDRSSDGSGAGSCGRFTRWPALQRRQRVKEGKPIPGSTLSLAAEIIVSLSLMLE